MARLAAGNFRAGDEAFGAALDRLLSRSAATILERLAMHLEQLATKVHRAAAGAETRLKSLKIEFEEQNIENALKHMAKEGLKVALWEIVDSQEEILMCLLLT